MMPPEEHQEKRVVEAAAPVDRQDLLPTDSKLLLMLRFNINTNQECSSNNNSPWQRMPQVLHRRSNLIHHHRKLTTSRVQPRRHLRKRYSLRILLTLSRQTLPRRQLLHKLLLNEDLPIYFTVTW